MWLQVYKGCVIWTGFFKNSLYFLLDNMENHIPPGRNDFEWAKTKISYGDYQPKIISCLFISYECLGSRCYV